VSKCAPLNGKQKAFPYHQILLPRRASRRKNRSRMTTRIAAKATKRRTTSRHAEAAPALSARRPAGTPAYPLSRLLNELTPGVLVPAYRILNPGGTDWIS